MREMPPESREDLSDRLLLTGSGDMEINWDEARRFLRDLLRQKLFAAQRSHLEDLVQEALVRLLRATRHEPANNLEALMTLIAGRTLIDFTRRRRRYQALFVPLTDETDPSAQIQVPPVDISRDPEERVEFIVLEHFRETKTGCYEIARAFFQKRDWNSVARERGVSPESIRARWSRCVQHLRETVSRDQHLRLLADWAGG
jgi:RNA polymerase sigma factor (sigma-70 family)